MFTYSIPSHSCGIRICCQIRGVGQDHYEVLTKTIIVVLHKRSYNNIIITVTVDINIMIASHCHYHESHYFCKRQTIVHPLYLLFVQKLFSSHGLQRKCNPPLVMNMSSGISKYYLLRSLLFAVQHLYTPFFLHCNVAGKWLVCIINMYVLGNQNMQVLMN